VDDLARLRAIAQSLDELRQKVDELERLRGQLVRQLHRRDVKPVHVYRAGRLSRAGYYRLVAAPDDYAWSDDWSTFLDAFRAAEEAAVDAWLEAGQHGDPDDYFPLERLLGTGD